VPDFGVLAATAAMRPPDGFSGKKVPCFAARSVGFTTSASVSSEVISGSREMCL
jgi:hypothetical protein